MFNINDRDIIFDSKPDAIPFNYRLTYKVSQICFMLHKCSYNKGCSLIKIQLLNMALISNREYDKLIKYIDLKYLWGVSVRFDPSVNRALNYALADSLIYLLKGGQYKLTDKGKRLATMIEADHQLMINEKEKLNSIGNKLTEEKIQILQKSWGSNK